MVKKAQRSYPDCCLCNKVCENEFGNNPRPVAHTKGEEGVCCDKCNVKKVIPARITVIRYKLTGSASLPFII